MKSAQRCDVVGRTPSITSYNEDVAQLPSNHDAAQELAQRVAADLQAARQQSGLEAAPSVGLNFDHAQQAQTPLEPPTPASTPVTTSYAKTLDEGYEPSQSTTRSQPAPHQEQQQAQGEQQQGGGSEMVKSDAPEMKPVNTTEEAKIVDRDAFDQSWSAEEARADEAALLAEAVAADLQASRAQSEPEQQQGMDMG